MYAIKERFIYRPILKFVACITACMICTALFSQVSFAKSYSIDSVEINATLDDAGNLNVFEQRQYDFHGSYNGVYWLLPTGVNKSNGLDTNVTVTDAGILSSGEPQSFLNTATQDFGVDSTYAVYDEGSNKKVKLYSAHKDSTETFYIKYTINNLATRWSDTSELYWKFISDGWDEDSHNVHLHIAFNSAAQNSESENELIKVWGHGNLNGTVKRTDNSIEADIPVVYSDDFAEIRATFPTSWIAKAPEQPDAKLNQILEEEKQYAEKANETRRRVKLYAWTTIGATIALFVITVIYTWTRLLKEKRHKQEIFSDKYFRDLPTNDHPLVLGYLYQMTHKRQSNLSTLFSAELIKLADDKVVDIRSSEKKKLLGKKTEVIIGQNQVVTQDSSLDHDQSETWFTIDRQFERLLFDTLFKLTGSFDQHDRKQVNISALSHISRKRAQEYGEALEDWKFNLEGEYETKFVGSSRTQGSVVAVALIILTFVIGFFQFVTLSDMILGVMILISLINLAILTLGLYSFNTLNDEGLRVSAQLDALKKWLEEFTLLDEAIPNDIVLWNKLLVMATVFGIADKVMDQLKIHIPEMFEDESVIPYWWWFYGYHSHATFAPMESINSSINHLNAEAFSSSFSSASGSGGGFSSGGGGGFGGGGGGGAF